MGLFNRSKQPDPVKQMLAAGGNFNYIAQMIATQYFILTQTDYAWMLDEDERMYAVALINASAAARSGDVSMDDLRSAAEDSFISRIHLGDYSQSHGLWVDTELERLCNLVMQIEALAFKSSTPEKEETIVESVIENKTEIVSMVKRTLQQGKNSPLYAQCLPAVTNMINDHVFRYLIECYTKIIELENREIELMQEVSRLEAQIP